MKYLNKITGILFTILFGAVIGCIQRAHTSLFHEENEAVLLQLYENFDLSTFQSSYGPRLDEAHRYLKDFHPKSIVDIKNSRLVIDQEDWFMEMELVGRGDFNEDHIEDIKVRFTDQGLVGSYHTVSELVLTRRTADASIVAISTMDKQQY